MFGAGSLAFQTQLVWEAGHSSLPEDVCAGCLFGIDSFVAANALRVDQPAESEVHKFKSEDPPAPEPKP